MNDLLDDTLRQDITRAVKTALSEDVGSGDITAELIPADQKGNSEIITREDCVICGTEWLNEVFRQLGGVEAPNWHVREGDFVVANTKLVSLSGNARALLTGERTALNFLQTLSGTATQSREFAKLVKDTAIKILDTRKTIPGMRLAQKYAVAVGGCHNHRIGLYDAFLIKENHIAACGSITAAVTQAKAMYPEKPIIVEVETLDEFCEAAQCPVDRIMLDNFDATQLTEVAALNCPIPLEVSGNITAESVAKLTRSPISAISSGALTKHVRAIDLSMRFV